MKAFNIPIEISFGALLLAGLLAGAAMAQNKDNGVASPPPAQVPATLQNRTGLPPAPPDVVAPGSAARPFTGNDVTQPPGQMIIVPKDRPVIAPK